mmetsp:Transcript_39904/g.61070  ORF Transcript_39904/g.61070 Transcript_39904/m.61070 type:complete len:134 (+) Transcript_39904:769-1170(+)|eukprot:CAMPEP_0170505492 /NCGR_PEP_ID=MMETSP0208-20121228/51130_1 /TAXON_ID=197538 /ORGANISM="Strombidium inclinatum, Strain S3" /LENGTH=133 /DNA_ID=CAMNT_0010786401 /DNA_START=538 /DNA_END=939 /DNA_ORIENTATION=-
MYYEATKKLVIKERQIIALDSENSRLKKQVKHMKQKVKTLKQSSKDKQFESPRTSIVDPRNDTLFTFKEEARRNTVSNFEEKKSKADASERRDSVSSVRTIPYGSYMKNRTEPKQREESPPRLLEKPAEIIPA